MRASDSPAFTQSHHTPTHGEARASRHPVTTSHAHRCSPKVRSAVAALLALYATQSLAIADERAKHFDIERQTLAGALSEFARQSDRQILFSTDAVSTKHSAGVKGDLEPEAALRSLLQGTGLTYRVTRDSTILVVNPESDTTARLPVSPPVLRLAQASDSSTSDTTAPQPDAAAAEDSTPELQQIVVTGSRIARRDYTATSPIVTVEAGNFERSSAVGIESSLNQLPQFQPGATQFDAARNIQSSAFGGIGAATVNLRGLGTNRTLVLVDGKRAQPADATLVVDVNSIPAAAISRVEVITGGASAVYGADALSGVVNFILKDDFEGFSADVQSSITEEGDGAETRINALYGAQSASGRGNVMLGADWTKRSAIALADREFFTEGWRDPGTTGGSVRRPYWRPANAPDQPSQAALDEVFGQYAPGSASRTANIYFNTDNSLFQANPALNYNSGDPNMILRSNGALTQRDNPGLLSSPLERYSAFGRARYNFTDNITGYVQANFSSTEVESRTLYNAAVTFWGASIPFDDQHPVPEDLATLLRSRANPTANWALDQNLVFAGPQQSRTTSNVYQVLAGFKGSIPNTEWTWDVYASQGRTTTLTQLNGGFLSLQRYREIIQAPFYGEGYVRDVGNGFAIRCTSGLSPFSNEPVSQDCIDAVSVTMKNQTNFEQQVFEGTMQGGLFKLPAGEVRTALGASYRKNTVDFTPDGLLSTSSVQEQPIGLYAVSSTAGTATVWELYGELLVPLLTDKPFVQALDLELGARYSDYNTAGGQNTWKALANWTVNDYLSFRGGMQRAARAPNTAELFSGETLSVVGFAPADPCSSLTQAPWGNVASNPNRAQVQALCSAIIGSGTSRFDENPNGFAGQFGFFPFEIEILSGNSDLKPEVARTWTAGLVFRSPFESPLLSQLTASLDWYDISIEGVIESIDSVTTYSLCFNANGTSNPTYSLDDPGGFCSFIERDPISGDRLRVKAPFMNLGGLRTSGVDLQLSWRAMLSDMGLESVPGALSVNYLINYLNSYETQASPGAPFLDYVGTVATSLQGTSGQYRWRSFTTLGYSMPTFDVQLTWRHLPSARDGSVVLNPLSTVRGVDSYDIFNLSGTWHATDSITVRAGVDNLFNKDPLVLGANPPTTNNADNTLANYYDVLGRRYYLGVKMNF